MVNTHLSRHISLDPPGRWSGSQHFGPPSITSILCLPDLSLPQRFHTRVFVYIKTQMAAVRSSSKQGAPFSAWEAMDTLFEQAFSRSSTLSPLYSSPLDIVDRISKLPRSFGVQDPYHKSVPVPRHNDYRKDSLSSSPSSISSGESRLNRHTKLLKCNFKVSTFDDIKRSRATKPPVPVTKAAKPLQAIKTLKVPSAAIPLSPLPSPTKSKPRTSRYEFPCLVPHVLT